MVLTVNCKLNCKLTMSEKGLKSDQIRDLDKFIKPRKDNKFSIENILGLNEGDKANRMSIGKDFVLISSVDP